VKGRYEVIFTAPAERIYRKLGKDVQRRILAKAEKLQDDPFPPGAEKLTGHDAYRVRVGDYRIIYAVQAAKLVILILDVGHRREVYRNW
jgi:mRNA interferase RelE/StbE